MWSTTGTRRASHIAAVVGALACCFLLVAASVARAEFPAGRLHFDWKMPDTYGSVLDANGLPRPAAPGEVRAGPWRVDLVVPGCDPDADYSWFVDGARIAPRRVEGCTFSSDAFPRLGRYSVEVQARVAGAWLEGREDITIDDWLIVSLGDSVASGEGVPEVAGIGRAKWAETRCHRSGYAGPAVAAQRLAERSPHVSITFVHLACSGAQISEGLLGGYKGIAGPSSLPLLPPQVKVLDGLAGRRRPAAVLISIGANDVGFSDVVKKCATHPHTHSCFQGTIGGEVAARLKALAGRYAELDEGLRGLSSPVYLTEYFDPTGNVTGSSCASVLKPPLPWLGRFGLNHEDVQDARTKLLSPLNVVLAEAALRYHWTEITGIASEFRDHGYCAGSARWITTLLDSVLGQGSLREPKASIDGTLHPNREGQQRIAGFIQAALEVAARRTCGRAEGTAKPVANSSPQDRAAAETPCWAPRAEDLPLVPIASTRGLGSPWWLLVAIGALASGLLLVTMLASAVTRVREIVPVLLAALLGAALIVLGVGLIGHTAPAVVLIAAGALVLVVGPLLLLGLPRPGILEIRRRLSSGGGHLFAPMDPSGGSTTNLVVVCLGAALVVFFAGVTAAVAAGQTPPTALWAAGSAVSGALVGLLMPAPGAKKGHEAAAVLAEETAKASGDVNVAAKFSAEAAAHKAAAVATPETRGATILLAVVFFAALAVGVFLAAGGIVPPSAFTESLKSVTTAVIALASASGSALIGILAPSQGKGG